MVAGIFGMWVEDASLAWQVLGLLNALFAAFVINLLMFNDSAAEFLATQRTKNFGFSGGASNPAKKKPQPEKSKTGQKSEENEDAWDAHDDLYE